MKFIRDLEEARLTRNVSNLKSLTYTDCCERAFLTLLALELLRNYPGYNGFAGDYCGKTLQKSDYSQFRAFSTDLYNFVYFIVGDDEALDKLKNPDSAKAMRDKISFPVFALNRYLRSVTNRTRPTNIAAFFIQIENSLNIRNSDYKAIRRNITNYTSLSQKDRESTVTRLLFAARAKLRSSDIIDELSGLAADRNLETDRVRDTEPKISVSDPVTTSGDLALYRLLVGSNNLMRTKRFLDLARSGHGIPPVFTQGYMPIINMIDDMVKGGPMYVQLLRQIHNRSKKASKP